MLGGVPGPQSRSQMTGSNLRAVQALPSLHSNTKIPELASPAARTAYLTPDFSVLCHLKSFYTLTATAILHAPQTPKTQPQPQSCLRLCLQSLTPMESAVREGATNSTTIRSAPTAPHRREHTLHGRTWSTSDCPAY